MAKKLSKKYIIDTLKEHALDYLDSYIQNRRLYIKYVCINGHVVTTRWDKWVLNRRCKVCYGRGKPTIAHIKKVFEDGGCKLLTDYYGGSTAVLQYVNSDGIVEETCWNHWQNNKIIPTSSTTDINDIRNFFMLEGYVLLSTKYINSKTKLDYICSNGHRHSISWREWSMGNRCPYCSKKIKKTFEEVKQSFADEGYTLLSTVYNNATTKLDYVCPEGHAHIITWYNWYNGYRCPTCIGQTKPTIDEIYKSFEAEGYTLLSTDYVNNHSKLDYICPEGHKHHISWIKWQQGRRCRECSYILRSGENSSNWKGGISFEPYCEVWKDQEYKSDIKVRDGNRCLNPYCYGNDSVLSIHHIDYDKKNCHPKNLITVCRSCNARANYDRQWHKAWYQAVMHRRYNYIY